MTKLLGATLLAALSWCGTSNADDWTGALVVTSVQPLLTAEGGVVRVAFSTSVSTAACGTTNQFDLVLSGGTPASQSALVAALYMSVATGKITTFLVSSSACSPWGSPLVVGMNIVP